MVLVDLSYGDDALVVLQRLRFQDEGGTEQVRQEQEVSYRWGEGVNPHSLNVVMV
jgi:hypothetical protein